MNASVYLAIPGNLSGKGKVTLSVKGSYKELDAMTEQELIPTGSMVTVQRIEGNSILIVSSIKPQT